MMLERNYTNYNEVYPILDMINRKVKQMGSKAKHHFFDSPIVGDGGSGGFDTSQWEVESFEVVRDTDNAIDPNIIEKVIIVYRNGAVDEISLTRGLNPPVDKTVQDHEYINNLMIVEVTILTRLGDQYQEIIARIFRENGYGLFQKVELDYTFDGIHWEHTDDASDVEEYPPDDFYGDGGYWQGDEDDDAGEDYAGTEYLPEDEIQPPEDGWADGYNPSDPIDIDVNTPITMIPNEEEI